MRSLPPHPNAPHPNAPHPNAPHPNGVSSPAVTSDYFGFSIQRLLGWAVVVAIYFAALQWILTSDSWNRDQALPFEFIGVYLLAFGMLIAPFLFLGCTLSLIFLQLMHRTFAYSMVLYTALATTTIILNLTPGLTAMHTSHRCLLALAGTLLACMVEFILRRKEKTIVWLFGLCFVGTIAFFVFLQSVYVCSQV